MHPEDAVLFLRTDMDAVELRSFCGGTAAVFTRRSPFKEAAANEDAAALVPFGEGSGVLVVADGAGGTRGGDQASSTMVYEMVAALEHAAQDEVSLREAILNGIETANRDVSTLGIGAATTVAVAELQPASMRAYHVGDSEVMLVGPRGKLKLQTVSHSPMGYAVHSGLVGEREAMHHEDRHLVTNLVGTADMRIELGPLVELAPRDTVLVACDGLFDNLHTGEIVECLCRKSLQEAAEALVERTLERMTRERANQPSKPDDLTLLAFRREGSPENGKNGNGPPE